MSNTLRMYQSFVVSPRRPDVSGASDVHAKSPVCPAPSPRASPAPSPRLVHRPGTLITMEQAPRSPHNNIIVKLLLIVYKITGRVWRSPRVSAPRWPRSWMRVWSTPRGPGMRCQWSPGRRLCSPRPWRTPQIVPRSHRRRRVIFRPPWIFCPGS